MKSGAAGSSCTAAFTKNVERYFVVMFEFYNYLQINCHYCDESAQYVFSHKGKSWGERGLVNYSVLE